MPISFLELTPKAATETVTLDTASGAVEIELRGLSLSALSNIGKRFPAFAKIIEGGGGSLIEASEAMPSIIAAGLGFAGVAEYEEHARQFGAAEMLEMVRTVMRLTMTEAQARPLAESQAAPLVNGQDVAAPEPISPLPLSN